MTVNEFHNKATLRPWMRAIMPAACRAKLDRVYEECEELGASASVVFDHLHEAGEDVVRKRMRLDALRGPHSGASAQQVEAAAAELQLAEDERQRLQAQHDRLSTKRRCVLATRQAVADFFAPPDPAQRPPAALAEAAPVETGRAPNEPHDAALARLQKAIAAELAAITAAEEEERPVSEALAVARKDFEALQERGSRGLDVRPVFLPDGGHIKLPDIPAYGRSGGTIATAPIVPDTWAALAVLFPEQVWELFEDKIRKHASGKKGIASADRPRVLAELRAKLLHLERQEEAIIEEARAAGLQIDRRPDADARAILGVEVVDAPAAQPNPGTSPQWRPPAQAAFPVAAAGE